MTKAAEKIEEDGVVEDSWDWRKRTFNNICVIFWLHQEQQEEISLTMKDGTQNNFVDNNNRSSTQRLDAFDMESIDDMKSSHNDDTENIGVKSNINDNWSDGSECTCETESTDIEENKQAITKIQVIDGTKRQNTEKQVYVCTRNHITTVCFLDLQALLENPDNHKEKPLTCDMEPDIQRAQQWKLVYGRKIKKKIAHKRSLDNQTKHKPVPLSCDLEPDIAVMQREMISRMKLIIRDTRRLVDLKMHSMEPLSCNLEPDIVITYTKMTKQQIRK